MSLFTKIEELQNKPKSYRKKVLVVLMISLMAAVILAWVSTSAIFAEPAGKSLSPSEVRKKSGVEYAPLNILKEGAMNIKDIFNQTLDQIKGR